jgi:DNA mismatch repair protein MutL
MRICWERMKIALLPDDVINQIAAGEVIENPASVIKELIDNAIDALAKRIDIEILSGGQQLIKVEDDGCGMSRADVEMCLLRHATSKLQKIHDLESLQTMGFRGEALAAIAAISRLEILTSDGTVGTRLSANAGRVETVEVCARNCGTSIEVRSLFFNTPARRKFQKSPQANSAQVVRILQSLALTRPEIAFTLRSQGQMLLDVPCADWKGRIEEILGSDLAKNGIWIEQPEVWGWLGAAEEARSTRSGQHFFVNRRPVFSPILAKAVREGYGTRIAEGAHPPVVLFLNRPSEELDVNVHPQKREVRFHNESKVFCLLRESIQRAFLPSQNAFFEPPCFSPIKRDPWDEPVSVFEEKTVSYVAEQRSLWSDEPKGEALAVVGSFLLAKRGQEVVLVDLSVAQENRALKQSDSQTLLLPIRLSLSNEDVQLADEIIFRCAEAGIEAKVMGPKQLCLDAIPNWLDEADAPLFFDVLKEDLHHGLTIQETVHRFCRTARKRFSLHEASRLWESGLVKEVCIKEADLERLFTRNP